MTQFTVDADELGRMASQASQLASELDSSQVAGDALDGIAGSDAVQQAYGGFIGHWSDGLFFAKQNLTELSDRLQTAASAYVDTDGTIASAASGSGSGANAS
jgi:hypothetical protein